MINDISELYGRQIESSNVSDWLLTDHRIQRIPAISDGKCNRCGYLLPLKESRLPNGHVYCRQCIQMGRMATVSELITVKEPNQFSFPPKVLSWHGQLTVEQTKCANEIVNVFTNRQTHLLWAVTGAGKTEMLFRGIEKAILAGKRIAVASPRVDVCIELFPRLQAAFDQIDMILLHGQGETKYRYTQLVVCTTHQLLRFKEAFDVVIIDEVDVFPFSGNDMLHFAVKQAAKPKAAKLYLTATPDRQLLMMIRRKQISVSYLPLRFHRHLLPTISVIKDKQYLEKIGKLKCPTEIKQFLNRRLADGRPFLIFAPRISDLDRMMLLIKPHIGGLAIQTVFSADSHRLEKVQMMRQGQLNGLITTTILERGVTFSKLHVLIVGADNEIFSAAALVQIAGRVGRKADCPDGEVRLLVSRHSATVREAEKQIIMMNRRASEVE
ncbi:DEAD/DEAH box helicase family protein [Lentilactobacillus sp. Marseille-Q4993]|uniref:DEAD/DEAH box helicase n=1 Tax=Lentilactobacillus sp. Marseille-Q4993 TaxID=3039492 RepID=UPI0024BC043F|nr:DEAD/DEAH box helicase family protein [Lentilactobacillus sp. Marseille-Q4993]